MARRPGGLGRGINDILDDNSLLEGKEGRSVLLNLSLIEPRSDQPRKKYDREAMEQLADSIAANGVLQPIIVRKKPSDPGIYEIVAGERRWRASRLAGLKEIPAVIFDGDDLRVAQVAMIENVQREDLNPVEEAFGYQMLIERFGLTQDEVAKQVGKSRPAVANVLRLLDLPDEVLEYLRNGNLTAGHARALLGLTDESKIVPLADKVVARSLSVRETEATVKRMNETPEETPEQSGTISREERAFYKKMEKMAAAALSRPIRITRTEKKKVLEVPYETAEDLTALLTRLCGEEELRQAESAAAARRTKKETKGL